MKTFQKPLSASEEKLYLEKYKQGDIEAKNVLIERNMRLVVHIAKKYQCLDEELDDVLSIGTIGLIKAVMTFDSDKGNKLATYAARCIENEILMMLRNKKKTSKDVYLYDVIGYSKEGDEVNLIDILESKEISQFDKVALDDDIVNLKKIIETELTEREKKIIKMRYGLDGCREFTQKEIANKLGISRSYISRIEKNAINKIKSTFGK